MGVDTRTKESMTDIRLIFKFYGMVFSGSMPCLPAVQAGAGVARRRRIYKYILRFSLAGVVAKW